MGEAEFLSRFERVRRSGREWSARCPAHDDRTPSLSIGRGSGRWLLRCHAGCSLDAIVAAVGLQVRDLFDQPERAGRDDVVVSYDYHDRDGQLVFQVVRYAGKRFRQRRPDGEGGWIWNLRSVERPLYRLCEVVEGVAAGETIYVAEGEKDVHSLERAGVRATCNAGGAGKWRAEYSEVLRGAEVVVAADRDKAGRLHADQVRVSLEGIAASVTVVEPAEGKDVSDHLAAGRTLAELVPIVAEATGLVVANARPSVSVSSDLSLADVLALLVAFVRRFVAQELCASIVCALWVVHAWVIEATSTTPYVHVTSPEAESGKTRLLEVLELLVPRPLSTSNITAPALFRTIDEREPTLFIDEADNLFADRAAKADLLGIINSGYRRGKCVHRLGGAQHERLDSFEVFCPKMIAGLEDLPPTTASRSLRIEMKRRKADEPVEGFFFDEADADAVPLRQWLAAWANEDTIARLRAARPARLGVRDRLEEGVRLLLAIAAEAGPDWDTQARAAITDLSGASTDGSETDRVRLLTDLRDVVFANHDEVPTADVLHRLFEIEARPWAEWWADPRSDETKPTRGAAMKLAKMLKPLQIRSRDIHITDSADRKTVKGYARADFQDAFARYVPPVVAPAAPSQHQTQIRASEGRATLPSWRDLSSPGSPHEQADGATGATSADDTQARVQVRRDGPSDTLTGPSIVSIDREGLLAFPAHNLTGEQAILRDAHALVASGDACWIGQPPVLDSITTTRT